MNLIWLIFYLDVVTNKDKNFNVIEILDEFLKNNTKKKLQYQRFYFQAFKISLLFKIS